jgi:pyruvate kinase
MGALFTAHHLKVKAIVALTQSGSTALWMSRLNAGVPIFALTPEAETQTKVALFRDVRPFALGYEGHDRERLLYEAEKVLLDQSVVQKGDIIVITMGEPIGQSGGTNTMKIVTVGEQRSS